MATLSIESSLTTDLTGGSSVSYVSAWGLGVAYTRQLNESTFFSGQYLQAAYPAWNVVRAAIVFDLSGLPENAELTAATLKLYGAADESDTDFTLSVADVSLSDPPQYSDYSRFRWGLIPFGTLSTSGFSVGSFNDIALNAAGLAFINASVQAGEVQLGVRSANDLALTAPTQNEFVSIRGQAHASRPVLELTYSDWPNEVYPTVPTFPTTGKIDLATYGVISNYMTGMDTDLSLMADTSGNIDIGESNWITWASTSEKIAYDAAESNVTVTTLAYSSLSLVGGIAAVDLAMTNNSSATDCTVANDAQLSDTAYATIQSQVTDNEVVFTALSAPSPADDEGDVYMDLTSGDLMLKTRDDGQAGVKTDTLVDYSAI